MNVSSWSIRNPTPAILFFLLLTLAGLIGFQGMKIQQFMDIELPTVTVTASLPGAAPAQMETEVARKIENSVATLQGIKHIYTKVQDGTAIVTVEFRLEKPTQEAVDDVRDAVSRIRADLPGDLKDPVVSKVNLSGAPILTYTVASPRMDDEALSWFVDNTVSKALLSARGVGAVSRVGCSELVGDICEKRYFIDIGFLHFLRKRDQLFLLMGDFLVLCNKHLVLSRHLLLMLHKLFHIQLQLMGLLLEHFLLCFNFAGTLVDK